MKSLTTKALLVCIAVTCGTVIFTSLSSEPGYDSGITRAMESLTYHWLSGNSRGYDSDLADFADDVAGLRGKSDKSAVYSLGRAFLLLFTSRSDQAFMEQAFKKYTDMHFQRLHCIYAMQNPGYKGFTIAAYTKYKKNFKDYDYLWAGSFYLIKGDARTARGYYLEGIQRTSRLRKSFDIMMESAETYGKLPRSIKAGKHFIAGLPYVRPHDAFLYFKNETGLAGYPMMIEKAGRYSDGRAGQKITDGVFPIFTDGDLPYLTNGDIFLLCRTYLALQKNDKLLKGQSGEKYLPRQYRSIVAFLLKKRIIGRYIDGNIHIISPVSGCTALKIFGSFTGTARRGVVTHQALFAAVQKEYKLSEYRMQASAAASFKAAGLSEMLAGKKFPVYRGKGGQVTAGDMFLLFHTLLVLKNKEALLNALPPEGAPKPQEHTYLPEQYRKVVKYLVKEKIIVPDAGGWVDINRAIHPLELEAFIQNFRRRV